MNIQRTRNDIIFFKFRVFIQKKIKSEINIYSFSLNWKTFILNCSQFTLHPISLNVLFLWKWFQSEFEIFFYLFFFFIENFDLGNTLNFRRCKYTIHIIFITFFFLLEINAVCGVSFMQSTFIFFA